MKHSIQVLIVVDSWQRHTARVAQKVVEGVRAQGGTVVLRMADDAAESA